MNLITSICKLVTGIMDKPITKEEEITSLIVTIKYHENFLKLVENDLEQQKITLSVIEKYKAKLSELQKLYPEAESRP